MYRDLRYIPIEERPQPVPVFPRGFKYFKSWRNLRWFLLMLLAPLSSAFALWAQGYGLGPAFLLGCIGSAITILLFVTLRSGISHSNIGTYFRRTEPIRYWVSTAVIMIIYILLSLAGYIWSII